MLLFVEAIGYDAMIQIRPVYPTRFRKPFCIDLDLLQAFVARKSCFEYRAVEVVCLGTLNFMGSLLVHGQGPDLKDASFAIFPLCHGELVNPLRKVAGRIIRRGFRHFRRDLPFSPRSHEIMPAEIIAVVVRFGGQSRWRRCYGGSFAGPLIELD